MKVDQATLTKTLANVAMFLLCLGGAGFQGYQLAMGKPWDPTIVTFLAFIIGNYSKTLGFDQGATVANATIDKINGTVAASAANTSALLANTAQMKTAGTQPLEDK